MCTPFFWSNHLRPKHGFPIKSDMSYPQHACVHDLIHLDVPRTPVRDVEDFAKTQSANTLSRFIRPLLFTEFHAHFITRNHQTKLASIFRRPTDLGYK